jgi:hypothetical protein
MALFEEILVAICLSRTPLRTQMRQRLLSTLTLFDLSVLAPLTVAWQIGIALNEIYQEPSLYPQQATRMLYSSKCILV